MKTASPIRRPQLSFALALLLVLGGRGQLAAQEASCATDSSATARICQAGVDALTALLPVEGALIGGGNPVPGTAAAIGKFGHVRLAGRVGLVRVTVPESGYDGSSDTVKADKQLLVPLPRLDLDLGLFSKKLALGVVSMDLLGSVVALPASATSRVRFDENARTLGGLVLGFGFGFRAALTMPGPKPTVSLSVMKRDMPAVRFGDLSAGDRLSAATTLSAISVRLLVGGRAKLLSLAAGGGIDLYTGEGSVTFADSTGSDSTIAVSLSTSRIMTLLNAGFDLGPINLWAEGGFQVGKKTELVTVFQRNNPSSGHFFGGLGVALHF